MFSNAAPTTSSWIPATHRRHLDTRCHHLSCVPPPSWSPHHPTISTAAAVAATNHRNYHHHDHGRTISLPSPSSPLSTTHHHPRHHRCTSTKGAFGYLCKPPPGCVWFFQCTRPHLDNLSVFLEGVNLVNMRDRWSWSLDGPGEFFVACVRNLIDEHRLHAVSTKTRWSKAVPIKIDVHAWKVKMDCLPTRFNISRRGMEIDYILCPSCGTTVESTSHIFFKCNIDKEVFHKITSWWDVDLELSSYEDWLEWLLNLRLSSKHKSLIEGISYTMWWTIRNFRIMSIVGSKLQSKASLFEDIVSRFFYLCKFRCKASFSWLEWLKNPYLVTL
uniref:RNA-directed DNA polymerase, eukaryota n=1 Tax=Tanacetum cinerariifolium TaxID=118510 RepID=A0A6L2LWP0_TANCI|nr:RNA-directed DNA polymerase, eukaryota [Tanacetum cinerariifolium]